MSDAHSLQLEIVSAESQVYSGKALRVIAPGHDGELGIMPRHLPLLTSLKPGQVRIQLPESDEEEVIYVSGGTLEVQPETVTVLTDIATRAEDLDEAKAKQAKERSEKLLQDSKSEFDHAKARAELAQALAQLRAIKSLRKHKKG